MCGHKWPHNKLKTPLKIHGKTLSGKTTIAAVSTALGPGGISIIRISGPDSVKVAEKVFSPARAEFPLESHKMYYGYIIDRDKDERIDQVLCVVMKAPFSYTREDVLEIHCHGGYVSATRILQLVLENDVIMAEPGEFTKRAFLSGRVDLSQAEAVAELIHARSKMEARMAESQLEGGIRQKIENVRSLLIHLLAHLEVMLDFPDEEAEIMDFSEAKETIANKCVEPLEDLIEEYKAGRVFREGVTAAIVGRVNVGKSSLLNALVREERSIVTEIPGTTRDTVEAEAVIFGIPVTLIDTAGLESSPADEAEKEGQRRAEIRLKEADLVIMVVDGSRNLSNEDLRIRKAIGERRFITVLNKKDLPKNLDEQSIEEIFAASPRADVSAKEGTGLESLKKIIYQSLMDPGSGGIENLGKIAGLVPNTRQKKTIEKALSYLENVKKGFQHERAPEIIALEIQQCLHELGLITGQTVTDDLMDEIFSKFCLGK